LTAPERRIRAARDRAGPPSAAVRAMARRTKHRQYVVTPCRITWLRGCISRRFVASESTRPGPTFPHPADKDVDLRVRQEASSALTESRHCSSRHALLNYAADRRITGDGEVHGTA